MASHVIQPCDWYEHDNKGKYVVDLFGRLDDESVACVRITGFKPFFYVAGPRPEMTATRVERYDVMSGFNDLKAIEVWKIECESMKAYREAMTKVRGQKYESNLPPFLRMFHQRHIGPGSPVKFVGKRLQIPCNEETEEPAYNIDGFFECAFNKIEPSEENIAMLVACYDLEMYSKSGLFPRASAGDPIVQIGVSYRWSDDMLNPVCRKVFVFGSVDASDESETEFIGCEDETDMLLAFYRDIREMNPDIMCGYNTFGFDDAYIEDRCKILGIIEEINFSRAPPMNTKDIRGNWSPKFSETKKFELASGKYDLRYLMMRGRLGLDLLLNMRREHSLDSFKLDSVASVFLRDKVIKFEGGRIHTKSTRGLRSGNYIKFDIVGNTSDPYRDGHKFIISDVQPKSFKIEAATGLFNDLTEKERASLEWTFTKDDVEPAELFRLHVGTSADRARIAKYCIQDCDLVLTLMAKLDTIVNARGMADVCKVPMEYVLRRGQGIKIFSAVVYYASQRNQIIATQQALEGDGGYEGAIVISPKIGMYLDQPVSVLDFNSLYPTNMISYNLSPDTLVCEKIYNSEGFLTFPNKEENVKRKAWLEAMEEKGYVFEDVSYDNKDDKDVVVGKTVCTYVQPSKDKPLTTGILPKTLDILLAKRKEYKTKMEDMSYDEAQRSVFNGLQLAYKVVANSVYGQTGSRTSPIRKLCVAACTTAAGRKQLYFAKSIVEKEFGGEVVYGDTDSIFIKFPTQSLEKSIELGIASGKRITELCRKPYKIAYEKTFFPFILFCRKRYVGMMYEEDPTPAKAIRKSMGIVLKRRDNAPIVKDVFGGALDILIQERDIKKAQAFTNEMLMKVLENKIPIEKYIVSKSLRDDYKNPGQIAHAVLAARMKARDPGTAPKVGDRIQFMFVAENKKAAKQGDRIEHVDYIKSKKLTPDTQFYITNQIQNPVAQLFALCIEQLDGYVAPKSSKYSDMYLEYMKKFNENEEEATLAVLAKKEKQLENMMFLSSPVLSKSIRANTRGPMDAFIRR
jgi:DNA polymerase elongation subunit (family B)